MCKPQPTPRGNWFNGKRYIGNDPALTGRTAIVKIKRSNPEVCYAQFDDTKKRGSYGWTRFQTKDFNFRPSELSEFWTVQGRN